MCVRRGVVKRYFQQALWIVVAASFLVMLLMQFLGDTALYWPITQALLVTVIFSFVATLAYGYAWKAVAKLSPTNLTKFYLAGSALRLMAALLVFLVYALAIREKTAVLWFTGIFVGFYLVLLLYDSLYFTGIEKRLNNK